MELVPCNLCGSMRQTPLYQIPDVRFYPDELFTIVECADCGLGFVNPRPSFEEIAKYYPASYYAAEPSPGFRAYLQRRFAAEVKFLQEIERRTGPKKLLDVGCWNGDFPRFMKSRGWHVEGVEVSKDAQRPSDFHVYTEEFQKIPVDEPTYDAITAWAVLEHVHDPMAYFRKASRVLKKEGRFVFLVTNFHSMTSRHLFGEDVPRHLYFFTRETVRRYLEKNGLILECEENGRSVHKMAPANWLGYLLQAYVRRKPFTYKNVPLSSREFRRVHGLPKGIRASMRYLAYSPTSVLERLLLPAVEAAQILTKTYGIWTYVAKKL